MGNSTRIQGKQLENVELSSLSYTLANNVVLATNGDGRITDTGITTTVLNYLSGLSSNAQNQLDDKLQKVWTALTDATGVLLTDSVVINRSSQAYKTTIGEILSQVDTEIFIIVVSLPPIGVLNKIYLLPFNTPDDDNYFEEWIYVNDEWELLGQIRIDLSNYYDKDEIDLLLETIENELGGKQDTITGGASSIVSSNLTTGRTLVSDGSGKVSVSTITTTELGHLSGISSNIQTQINGKYTIPAGTTSQYIRGDGSLATFPAIPQGTVTSVGISSTDLDVSNSPITSSGLITVNVKNKAITDAKLRDSSGLSIIGRSANTVGTPENIIATDDNTLLRRSGNTLSFGTIGNAYISDLEWSKVSNKPTIIPDTRTITAGTGLTGGGDLSTNRTISLSSGSIASLGKADSALQSGENVSLLTNDAGYTTNTGTVTSVSMSAPTGFIFSGSPITSSGTLALTYDTGYQGYTIVEATKLSGIETGATVSPFAKTAGGSVVLRTRLAELSSRSVPSVDVSFLFPGNEGSGAQGYYSFTANLNTTTTGFNNAAFGNGTEGGGRNSAAFGYQTETKGGETVAMGYGTIATMNNSLVIGRFNKIYSHVISVTGEPTEESPIFAIGNGPSDSQRKNAFEVYYNGKTYCFGTANYDEDYSLQYTNRSLVDKEYVDNAIGAGGFGTVTSVSMSVPTGLQISGSPITSSGTLALSYDTGYQGYTGTEATKLSGIETGAQVNVKSDWNSVSGDSEILNKPDVLNTEKIYGVDMNPSVGVPEKGDVLVYDEVNDEWVLDKVAHSLFGNVIEVTSATSGGTASKVCTTASGDYVPAYGDILKIDLSTANTANNPTLNIDGYGPINVRMGATNSTAVSFVNNVLVWYDGTYFQQFGSQRTTDTSTTYTSTTLSTTNTTNATGNLSINTYYTANYTGGQLVYNLPGTAAIGSMIQVYANQAGGFRINCPAGDNILWDDQDSGAAGYVEVAQYGKITLRCILANTTWIVVDWNGEVILNNGYKGKLVNLTNDVEGLLPHSNIANGTALSVFGRSSNSNGVMASIVAGTDHQVLRRSGTSIAFGAIELGQANATNGQLPVNKGGTGASTLTGILIGSGTSAITAISGTANQVLKRNASNTAYEFGEVGVEAMNYTSRVSLVGMAEGKQVYQTNNAKGMYLYQNSTWYYSGEPVETKSITADQTLVLEDIGYELLVDSLIDVEITVPNGIFKKGHTINMTQINDGCFEVIAGAGITLLYPVTFSTKSYEEGAIIRLKFLTDTLVRVDGFTV